MSEVATLADQRRALDALAQISAAFGHLPAVNLSVGHIYPDRLDIDAHDSLSTFEAWRTAVGIPADAVDYHVLPGNMHLTACGTFAGVTVELSGYAPPLPAVVGVGGAA